MKFMKYLKIVILLFYVFLLKAQNTYVVTSVNDPSPFSAGTNTLRWAINQANANPGMDIISFNIPGTAPHIIQLNSSLPAITSPITMDGNTQALNGYSGNAKRIKIRGTSAMNIVFDLSSNSSGSIIKNIEFTGSYNCVVRTYGSSNHQFINNVVNCTYSSALIDVSTSGNTFLNNIFGTDESLLNSSAFSNWGVLICGNNNLFGGSSPNDKNYFFNYQGNNGHVFVTNGNGNKIINNVFVNNQKNIDLTCVANPYPDSNCSNDGKNSPNFSLYISGSNAYATGGAGAAFPNDYLEFYKTNSVGIDALQLVGFGTASSTGAFNILLSGVSSGDNIIAVATDGNSPYNSSEFSSSDTIPVGLPPCCLNNAIYGSNITLNTTALGLTGTVCANSQFTLSATSCINTGLSYSWDLGDGSPIVSGAFVNHQYSTPGNYVITCTISGSSGCGASIQYINVLVTPSCYCSSAITGIISGNCPNMLFNFGLSSIGCFPPNTQYSWSFGDGTSLSGSNVASHAYTAPGNYYVICTIVVPSFPPIILNGVVTVNNCDGVINPCTDCIGTFQPDPGEYIASIWVKEESLSTQPISYNNAKIKISFLGGPTNIYIFGTNPAKNKIIEGWQRIEEQFTIPIGASDIKIELLNNGSSDAYFDDLRVFPKDGQLKTYVYDPITMRLTSILDENNYASFYEYNEEGKLIRIKKETEKGIMTVQENRESIKKK